MDLDGSSSRFAPTPSTSSTTNDTNIRHNDTTTDALNSNLVGFEANYVTAIAEQLGIVLYVQASQQIAQEMSSFLRNVFKLARKFQRSRRRKYLTTEDLEVAMAIFGHNQIIAYEPLEKAISFRYVGKHGRELFVLDDQELELATVLNELPPKLPLEVTLKAHWLVINGVQPAIPENPLPSSSKENLVDYESTNLLPGSNSFMLNQLAKSVRKTEQVQIKSTTTHAISLEQQVFFLKIMEAIMGQDEQKRIEALNCLQTDCGLRALLPRFSIAITEGVRCNIVVHNMAILVYLMRMIQALSQNPAVSMEPYFHELLPAIISCILSRQLSSNQHTSETHCVLREFSAELLAQLLKRYRLPHIHTRITRALSGAFKNDAVNCPLPTIYGACIALCELGDEVIQRVLVPHIPIICAAIQRVHKDKLYSHERSLSERLYNKIVDKLTQFARGSACEIPLNTYQDFLKHFGGFAEDVRNKTIVFQ